MLQISQASATADALKQLPKETMSFTDELLENNKAYAASFSGPLPLPPAKKIAVLACMDARINVYGALGLGY